MPMFEYECPVCGKRTEEYRKPSEVDALPPDCTRCEATDGPGTGTPMVRVISAPASKFPGASNWH